MLESMVKKTKGEKTREKIVEEAVKLFARHGYAETSVQMIADKLQLSQSAIFQHFSSKTDIYEGVRLHVNLNNHMFVDGKINIDDDAWTGLKKHCYLNTEWAFKNREEAQIIVLTYYFSFFNSDYLKINAKALEKGKERILKFILAGVREKLFKFSISADEAAEMIHEYLIGQFIRALSMQKPIAEMKSIALKQERFLVQLLGVK